MKYLTILDCCLKHGLNFRWMNGQHLRALPSEELNQIIGERWKNAGIVTESQGVFIKV